MDKKMLGKRINMARKDAGMTGDKLSEACNINATYLRQIESGAKMPSLPVFISLCKEMKASPSYLLSDILDSPQFEGMDEIQELLRSATPKQLRLISAMIKAALDALDP